MICNRNDYLPFKCSYCDMIVCVDHRMNHGNHCSLNELSFDKPDSIASYESLKSACDYCKRKTLTLELVQCHDCSSKHCLYHRHQAQHECKVFNDIQKASKAEDEARIAKQKEALAHLKSNLAPSNSASSNLALKTIPLDPKKAQLARRLRVMRIKQSARGPPNVMEVDKVFFEVRFKNNLKSSIPNTNSEKVLKVFTTKAHRVGRMVDWCADEFGVINKNHLDGEDQLILKKELDFGKQLALDSQKDFSYYLQDKQLENGDDLILTYAVR